MATRSAKRKVERQLRAFEEQLTRELPAFKDTSGEAIRERWDQCGRDTTAFMKTYTPHYRDADDADFHADLDAMMNYPEQAFFFLHGPREHAKSVRCRLNVLRKILNGEIKYFVFAAETITKAWEHIEYILFELEKNHRVGADFDIYINKIDSQSGKLRCTVKHAGSARKNYCMLQAVGEGTSGKGLTFLQYRPQGALVDDIEKTKDTYNRENGKKKLSFVKQELYPACTGPVTWLGNMGRKDSALHQAFEEEFGDGALDLLKENGSDAGAFARKCDRTGGRMAGEGELELIKGFIFRADTVQEDGSVRYLWPERFAPSWYESKRRILRWRYEGEFNGNPVNPGKIFNTFPSYGTVQEVPAEAIWFTWFDPAWGRSKSSSHKCWIVGAFDGHRYYLVDAYCRAGTPISEPIDAWYEAFDEYQGFGLAEGGFEDAYDQDQRLSQDLALAEDWNNMELPVWGMKNPGQKDVRIMSIDMLVNGRGGKNGRVLWPKQLNDDLQEVKNQMEIYDPQLNSIPKDGPDALAALIANLRKRWRNHSSGGYESLSKRRYRTHGRRRY